MIPPLSSLDLRGVTDTLRRWMAGLDAWARSMGTASRLNADADVALAGNSDQVLPTQKAVKAYADAITAAVDLVKSGELLATVAQHADRLAVFGIEAALHLLETGASPEDQETPVELITAETVK